jgi:1-acyl-sn-glycerol-3-phosphate acyltransferase
MDVADHPPIEALRPRRLRRRKPLRFRSPFRRTGSWGDVFEARPQGGRIRAVRRIALALLWTLLAMPIQALLVLLPGPAKAGFGRFYHATVCRLIGLKVQVVGTRAEGRPVLYLSNHSSWLDVCVLGGVLEASFVAKAEVGQWPGVAWIARLGRTVFVSRQRGSTGREAEVIRERLAAGDNLVLFPEGTTSDGTRVMPFRSALLGTADAARTVQPVSVVYDRLGGLPACRRDRPVFAWYGDMDLGSHFWRLARRPGARVTVLLHEPVDPRAFADRKALAAAVGHVVAEGAAALRQNRPVVPLRAGQAAPG